MRKCPHMHTQSWGKEADDNLYCIIIALRILLFGLTASFMFSFAPCLHSIPLNGLTLSQCVQYRHLEMWKHQPESLRSFEVVNLKIPNPLLLPSGNYSTSPLPLLFHRVFCPLVWREGSWHPKHFFPTMIFLHSPTNFCNLSDYTPLFAVSPGEVFKLVFSS